MFVDELDKYFADVGLYILTVGWIDDVGLYILTVGVMYRNSFMYRISLCIKGQTVE